MTVDGELTRRCRPAGDLTAPGRGDSAVSGSRPLDTALSRPKFTLRFCVPCNSRDRMFIDGRCCAEWSH